MRPQDVRVKVYTEGMATSESILDKLKNRDTQIATALGLDPAEAGTWFSVDLDTEFVEWNHLLFGKSAHVNAEVRRIRKARADAMGEVNPPAELADKPAMENAWKREYTRAICSGEEPEAATKVACDALGIAVPQQLDTPRRLGELGQLVRRPPETDEPQQNGEQ